MHLQPLAPDLTPAAEHQLPELSAGAEKRCWWNTDFACRSQARCGPELQILQKHTGKAPNGQTKTTHQLSGLTSAGVLSAAASLATSWSASFSASLSLIPALILSAPAGLALTWQELPTG